MIPFRLSALLLSAFAVLAVVLASVGLYGIVDLGSIERLVEFLMDGAPQCAKDQAQLGYYLQVDETVDIPLVIHDFPAGITMSVELIANWFLPTRFQTSPYFQSK